MVLGLRSFFLNLLFPKLCYCCRAPGELICQCCLRKLHFVEKEGRCLRCFKFLSYQEMETCSLCSPFFKIQAAYLFSPSEASQSLYRQACEGKLFAIEFFANKIRQYWAFLEVSSDYVAYMPNIPKDIILKLCKGNLKYKKLWPWRKKAVLQSFSEGKPLHLISVYPLPFYCRKIIERYSLGPVVLTSLFLSEDYL